MESPMSILSVSRPTSTRVRFDSRLAPAPITFGRGILPAESTDVIPASVTRIRIVGLVSAGTYAATTDGHGRREWASETTTGARLLGAFADRRYREGKVAIVADAPAKAAQGLPTVPTTRPAPSVAPRDFDAECDAWKLAFDLARDGKDGSPLAGSSAWVKEAFAIGLRDGARQLDADLEATQRLEDAGTESEMMDWQAVAYSPVMA
jgi:hypothetical protein